jgi:hypothetical protein
LRPQRRPAIGANDHQVLSVAALQQDVMILDVLEDVAGRAQEAAE